MRKYLRLPIHSGDVVINIVAIPQEEDYETIEDLSQLNR